MPSGRCGAPAEGSSARGLPQAFVLWAPLPIARDWHNRPASPGASLHPPQKGSAPLSTLMVARTSHSGHPAALRAMGMEGSVPCPPSAALGTEPSWHRSPGWPWMSLESSTHTPSWLHALPQSSAPALWIHCHKIRADKVWLLCSQKVFPTV